MHRSSWLHPARSLTGAVLAGAVLTAGALVAPLATSTAAPARPSSAPVPATETAVDPVVREAPIDGVDPAGSRLLRGRALTGVTALSPAVPADGYATVGLTWTGGAVTGQPFAVRTRTDGDWSGWQPMHADADHAPSPGGAEAATALAGTDPVAVGAVDAVQVKVTAPAGRVPAGLTLSVIDPGQASPGQRGAARLGSPAYPATNGAGGVTPRPGIFSRAQWGANESMRDGFAGYGEISAAFVHHTVNANDYTRAEVPAILRGIYAYHTQSQGWSDVGYNFLVDRFGRVWEGRWGGIARPVIGAHTLGFNEEAFAMSAIGNFETASPTTAMLRAYGRLFAWKLSLHGVDPDASVTIDGTRLRTVNGHRDAAATACPGRNLYARLGLIRNRADAAQHGWRGRRLARSVVSDRRPDLLVRQGDRTLVLAGDSGPGFRPAIASSTAWKGARDVVGIGDLTGDRRGDLLVVAADGTASTVPGADDGAFGTAEPVGRRFAGSTLVAGARDLTGDRVPDVVHRDASGVLRVAPGRRDGTFAGDLVVSDAYGQALAVTGAGDSDGDGDNDLLVLTAKHQLVLLPGKGGGTMGQPRQVEQWADGRMLLTAGFDMTGDRRPDLLVRTGAGRTQIRPGLGDGRYARGLRGWAGWEDARVSLLGDADGDGRMDALLRAPGGAVSVHPGRNAAWVHPVPSSTADWSGYGWVRVVGDWDGDGEDDVLARRDSKMFLLPGRGDGRFGAPVGGWSGWGDRVGIAAVGDWTGDGRPDLISRTANGTAWVHPGRGSAGFAAAYPARGDIGSPRTMFGVGRWTTDGAPDLMTRTQTGTLLLWPGNGPGGLRSPVTIATGMDRYAALIGVGDLDRDGQPDLVGRLASNDRLFLLPGQRRGLAHRVPIGSGPVPGSLG